MWERTTTFICLQCLWKLRLACYWWWWWWWCYYNYWICIPPLCGTTSLLYLHNNAVRLGWQSDHPVSFVAEWGFEPGSPHSSCTPLTTWGKLCCDVSQEEWVFGLMPLALSPFGCYMPMCLCCMYVCFFLYVLELELSGLVAHGFSSCCVTLVS